MTNFLTVKRAGTGLVPALFILMASNAFGQYKLNYGLAKPQGKSTLPKSLVPVTWPVAKPKHTAVTRLVAGKDGEWLIRDGWEMLSADNISKSPAEISGPGINTKNWYNATVPGTVLGTLVNEGIYPDPYYGLNNLAIPDTLCRQKWWYRTVFDIRPGKADKRAWLIFDGINYKANIWLNGCLLGQIGGAFQFKQFEITGKAKKGANVLAVQILPPPHPGIPHEESPSAGTGPNGGKLTLDGPTFFATEGWDWIPGIRDRDMGIWQDVKLKFTGDVIISDPKVVTSLPLPDTTSAQLTVSFNLHNYGDSEKKIKLKGSIGGVVFEQSFSIHPNETRRVSFSPAAFPQLRVKNPKLWWPNGYGGQPLYTLRLSAGQSDVKSVRFGIRELSYQLDAVMPDSSIQRIEYDPVKVQNGGKVVFDNLNRKKLPDGTFIPRVISADAAASLKHLNDTSLSSFLRIIVNGVPIFCRGGNWGMDDAMKNVSRKHLEPYFKLHQQENFNMVRNWTGESTEETFYDLCDEYGMLVWNDFWLSTEGYNLNASDDQLFLDNASSVIRRFVNHPSIAIWCPRNEGFAPIIIEKGLAGIIAKDDGTRLYQANSRLMNLRTSGPWEYFKDPSLYYSQIANGFSTELGSPSVPTAASIRKMMPLKDTWPISDVWYYHDLHDGQKAYRAAIDSLYGQADNLDDFCKKAQMVNYDSYRAMLESWNSRMWHHTTGLLLWMSHPAWPSTDWQTYSWDYETFGSYFGSKKACEPIHIQMNLNSQQAIVVNTTQRPINSAEARMVICDLHGHLLEQFSRRLTISANGITALFKVATPTRLTGVYMIRLTLRDQKGSLISSNDYWKSDPATGNFKMLDTLKNVHLILTDSKTIQSIKSKKTTFTLQNTSDVCAVAIKLNLRNRKTKEIVLPAYFSDGYFNLLPGERKVLSVNYDSNEDADIAIAGYNLNPYIYHHSAVLK
jgi:hypothetical protein